MKLKVGDIVTYKYETTHTNQVNNPKNINISYGIVESINLVQTIENKETFLVVNGNKVKESNIVSKVLTERV